MPLKPFRFMKFSFSKEECAARKHVLVVVALLFKSWAAREP